EGDAATLRAEVFMLRGLRPSCGDSTPCRELLKRLDRYFFGLKEVKKIFRSPASRAFDQSPALRKSCFAGTGRGTGLPVQTRNWIKGQESEGRSLTGWLLHGQRVKRGFRGEPRADFTANCQTTREFSYIARAFVF